MSVKPEKILKGGEMIQAIEIEETYMQFSMDGMENVVYEGTRILAFVESAMGSKKYSPLGSDNHDAYLGVFQITAEGVNSDRYRFAGDVFEHATSEKRFVDFIISLLGDQ